MDVADTVAVVVVVFTLSAAAVVSGVTDADVTLNFDLRPLATCFCDGLLSIGGLEGCGDGEAGGASTSILEEVGGASTSSFETDGGVEDLLTSTAFGRESAMTGGVGLDGTALTTEEAGLSGFAASFCGFDGTALPAGLSTFAWRPPRNDVMFDTALAFVGSVLLDGCGEEVGMVLEATEVCTVLGAAETTGGWGCWLGPLERGGASLGGPGGMMAGEETVLVAPKPGVRDGGWWGPPRFQADGDPGVGPTVSTFVLLAGGRGSVGSRVTGGSCLPGPMVSTIPGFPEGTLSLK